MQKLNLKDGLLYVSVLLRHGDKEITIDNELFSVCVLCFGVK